VSVSDRHDTLTSYHGRQGEQALRQFPSPGARVAARTQARTANEVLPLLALWGRVFPPETVKVHKGVADGAPDTLPTEEARAILARLRRK
jgi:hypothetical protein